MNLDHATVTAVLAVALVILTVAYTRLRDDRDHWRARCHDHEWEHDMERVPGIGGVR